MQPQARTRGMRTSVPAERRETDPAGTGPSQGEGRSNENQSPSSEAPAKEEGSPICLRSPQGHLNFDSRRANQRTCDNCWICLNPLNYQLLTINHFDKQDNRGWVFAHGAAWPSVNESLTPPCKDVRRKLTKELTCRSLFTKAELGGMILLTFPEAAVRCGCSLRHHER